MPTKAKPPRAESEEIDPAKLRWGSVIGRIGGEGMFAMVTMHHDIPLEGYIHESWEGAMAAAAQVMFESKGGTWQSVSEHQPVWRCGSLTLTVIPVYPEPVQAETRETVEQDAMETQQS